MSDFAERMQARRESEEAAAAEPKPRRQSRSLLPSPAPDASAGREELIAWATVVLGLGSDPIANVTRFGRHEDARMVLTLKSGQRIVFDRQAETFDAPVLRRRVIIATGAGMPHYGPGDVQKIATALMRCSELAAEDDDRAEACDWAENFLEAAKPNTIQVASFATAEGRWEALSILKDWKPPADLPPYAPTAQRSVVVLDASTGARLVRTADVAAHVRGLAGRPIPWATLHSRLQEIGWKHRGEVQQRQPGGNGKVKARVYAIPAGWEDR